MIAVLASTPCQYSSPVLYFLTDRPTVRCTTSTQEGLLSSKFEVTERNDAVQMERPVRVPRQLAPTAGDSSPSFATPRAGGAAGPGMSRRLAVELPSLGGQGPLVTPLPVQQLSLNSSFAHYPSSVPPLPPAPFSAPGNLFPGTVSSLWGGLQSPAVLPGFTPAAGLSHPLPIIDLSLPPVAPLIGVPPAAELSTAGILAGGLVADGLPGAQAQIPPILLTGSALSGPSPTGVVRGAPTAASEPRQSPAVGPGSRGLLDMQPFLESAPGSVLQGAAGDARGVFAARELAVSQMAQAGVLDAGHLALAAAPPPAAAACAPPAPVIEGPIHPEAPNCEVSGLAAHTDGVTAVPAAAAAADVADAAPDSPPHVAAEAVAAGEEFGFWGHQSPPIGPTAVRPAPDTPTARGFGRSVEKPPHAAAAAAAAEISFGAAPTHRAGSGMHTSSAALPRNGTTAPAAPTRGLQGTAAGHASSPAAASASDRRPSPRRAGAAVAERFSEAAPKTAGKSSLRGEGLVARSGFGAGLPLVDLSNKMSGAADGGLLSEVTPAPHRRPKNGAGVSISSSLTWVCSSCPSYGTEKETICGCCAVILVGGWKTNRIYSNHV